MLDVYTFQSCRHLSAVYLIYSSSVDPPSHCDSPSFLFYQDSNLFVCVFLTGFMVTAPRRSVFCVHEILLCVCSLQSCLTLWPLCPWDSPGKNTGVGCRALLQMISLSQRIKPTSPVSPTFQVGSLLLSHRESPGDPIRPQYISRLGFPGVSDGKESPCSAAHSSILAWRIPWTYHTVTKNGTLLSNFYFSYKPLIHCLPPPCLSPALVPLPLSLVCTWGLYLPTFLQSFSNSWYTAAAPQMQRRGTP